MQPRDQPPSLIPLASPRGGKRGEIRIAFGQDPSGRMVHISLISNAGLACGCICAACGTRLVAYIHVTKRQPHFGHDSSKDCRWARETALHRFGKQVIEEKAGVTCPPVLAVTEGGRSSPARWVDLRDVTLEHRFHEIVPDITATSVKKSRQLLIEIAVTHKSDRRKLGILQQRALSAIEIDLSGLRENADLAVIEDAILHSAPRKWLFNVVSAQEQKAQEQLDIQQAKAEAAPVLELIRLAQDRKLKSNHGLQDRFSDARYALKIMSLDHLTGVDIDGAFVFSSSSEDWQTFLLKSIIGERRKSLSRAIPSDLAEIAEEIDLIRKEVCSLTARAEKIVLDQHPDFLLPYQVIAKYLSYLVEHSVLDSEGYPNPSTLQAAHRQFEDHHREKMAHAARLQEVQAQAEREKKQRERKEQQQRQERARELKLASSREALMKVVMTLIDRLPDDVRKDFSFDAWTQTRTYGMTPIEHLNMSADSFLAELRGLSNLFTPEHSPPYRIFGLPFEGLLAERQGEQARRKIADERRLGENRVDQLRAYLVDIGLNQQWLSRQNRQLGLTPIGAAFRSQQGFEDAQHEARIAVRDQSPPTGKI